MIKVGKLTPEGLEVALKIIKEHKYVFSPSADYCPSCGTCLIIPEGATGRDILRHTDDCQLFKYLLDTSGEK
jgi:hypothetical protein